MRQEQVLQEQVLQEQVQPVLQSVHALPVQIPAAQLRPES